MLGKAAFRENITAAMLNIMLILREDKTYTYVAKSIGSFCKHLTFFLDVIYQVNRV